MKKPGLLILFLCYAASLACAAEIKIVISKNYLNFPVSHQQERAKMTFKATGMDDLSIVIRLAATTVDYWVFKDVSQLKGKTISINYEGDSAGLEKIYQDDVIAGADSLYKEAYRPQFHFTTKRGWINDPNGLIYLNGIYHLYYQHNPYEREWENMHWGHAISKDLIHWKELPTALFPDKTGTMFSGSAVLDKENTAGFGKGKNAPLVVAYTAASPERQVQCIAYSFDDGLSFTKYGANPVIDSKEQWNSVDTRDPKVFWYAPGRHWVLVLNERDGHSIYTSQNLRQWKYESHVPGFWECPDLFELPVDNNPSKKKWVLYGASGTYMLGSFNGKKFTPEGGKYYYTTGRIYAAQTFQNAPDNRRIQIGWGRVTHAGMPFNGMMLLPTDLSLRSTKEGIRLFSTPVPETETICTLLQKKKDLKASDANQLLQTVEGTDRLRLKTTIHLSHATNAGLGFFGQNIIDYDLNNNTLNGVFYSPEERTSMELTADIFIDKTSIEVFIDKGAYSYSMERKTKTETREAFNFWGNNITIKNLELYSIKSIW